MEVVHDKLILRIFVVVADSSQIPSTILSFSTSSQTVSGDRSSADSNVSFSESPPSPKSLGMIVKTFLGFSILRRVYTLVLSSCFS